MILIGSLQQFMNSLSLALSNEKYEFIFFEV